MIPYIGDISRQDAELLKYLAEGFEFILEFGCGASTQIINKYRDNTYGFFTSVDTDKRWIDKTIDNLDLLDATEVMEFFEYDKFDFKGTYDFIFVDGAENLRREFALKIWPNLLSGGVMAFHDTRRPADMRNLLEVIAHHQNEVMKVEMNLNRSNISLIFKKPLEQWYDWKKTEGRLPWQIGYGKPDLEYIKNYKDE